MLLLYLLNWKKKEICFSFEVHPFFLKMFESWHIYLYEDCKENRTKYGERETQLFFVDKLSSRSKTQ